MVGCTIRIHVVRTTVHAHQAAAHAATTDECSMVQPYRHTQLEATVLGGEEILNLSMIAAVVGIVWLQYNAHV
jgi:hypothetical protein